MAISKELQKKLDYYEQLYFALDKPVPFKDDIIVYPVTVDHYYEFYSGLPCLTMDKTIKYVPDENGRPKKVANIKGISQSYLAYLIDTMKNGENSSLVTSQLMSLLELVLKIPKGLYCPHCGHTLSYEEAFSGIEEYVNEEVQKLRDNFEEAKNALREQHRLKDENEQLPQELIEKVKTTARYTFLKKSMTCPECDEQMRDVFSIKSENGIDKLVIRNTEISAKEFDELKALIPRQNILDYEGDKYMDPDLKEELEIKSRLQNQDYTSPTLEKQLICVGIGTGYTLEYLHTLTIRKLSMFLRTIDKKETYYAQLQASMSGLVTFKESPAHWIFSDDKYNIAKELTDYQTFEKKFEHVT